MRFGAMVLAAALLSSGGAPFALAAETATFTPTAFAAAKMSGQPILVDIAASWCPTCKAQRPILGKLEADPRFKALKVFNVDFDAQKPVVRTFGARMQSTLIVFKGDREVGRSVGDTDAQSIEALLAKSL